jgi:hypothetical protein
MKDKLAQVDQKPFEWTKKQMASTNPSSTSFWLTPSQQASGDYIDSFTSKQLLGDTSYIDPSQKEYVVKWCAAALYAGGADTVRRLPSLLLLPSLSQS